MTTPQAYSNISCSGRMLVGLRRSALFLFCFTLLLHSGQIKAQNQAEYDEIPIFLDIPRVGGTEMSVVIRGNDLYLPVTDLFDFLKIRNVPASDLESVTGFFINQETTFSISRSENMIRFQDKTFSLQPGDLIKTESNLYLNSTFFGKIFGLECSFNFRNLSVTINSKLDLPIIREMRQEEMRKNLSRLKGEVKADTTIGRTYPMFKFGMADWAIDANEEINGQNEARLNLALGAMVAGGEANATLYYNSLNPFDEKQQYYMWRHVNNDFAPLKQVMIGKIPTNAISSLFNPVIGVQLTNTPTTFRRSFGSYALSDRTEPGWIVELYVNNVLVDYVKADASGFFTFQVPLVYGNSQVQLKFFGPWGEERVRQQNINIPFNFLPENTFEYNVGAGFVEDSVWSRFSKASINYGVTRKLTVGGGVEYLSSIKTGPAMPYINGSLSLFNNLLLSGEYAYGVRSKGTLSYRMPSNLQVDLTYTKYKKGQEAIIYNYLEERRAVISMPLVIKKFSTYQRLTFYQIILPASKYTTGEWLFSGSLLGVSTNLTTYAVFIGATKPSIYSNLSLAARLPAGFIVMPQIQYGYSQSKLLSMKISLEKRFLDHAYLNMSYESNFANNLRMAELGLRYDFSFAQTGLSVRQANNKTSFVQYARGSLLNDSHTKYLGTDNRPNVGKGGISIIAYIDLNANGKRDKGEPKAYGLNLHANGGRIEKSERDSTIRILGLEPYTSCLVDLDQNSFENISWRLPFQTMSVAVDPNIIKDIEIPVMVVGEANGHVLLDNQGEKNGLERIIISFFNSGNKPIARTLTENDGYFSFFGLAPGTYLVRPDSVQLRKLGMTSQPEFHEFSVRKSMEGEVVGSLDFILSLKPSKDSTTTKVTKKDTTEVTTRDTTMVITKDTTKVIIKDTTNVVIKDTTKVTPVVIENQAVTNDTTTSIIHEMTEVVYTSDKDSWTIQIGAFKSRSLAESFKNQLEKSLGKKVEITVAGDYYRVRILDLPNRTEVDENIIKLNKLGFRVLWIIKLLAGQQQMVLKEKLDTLMPAIDTMTVTPNVPTITDMTVQLGAFQQKSNAYALLNKLRARFGDKIKVIYENGFYKLRVTGIPLTDKSVLETLKKYEPALAKLGLKDAWLLPPEPFAGKEVSVPEREVVTLEKVKVRTNIPSFAKPFEAPKFNLRKTAVAKPAALPTISIRVAEYYKKRDALKAQRKIFTKLKLNAEIIQQWDYYIVLIRGFYTREETYKYYPELAGIGFPGVTLIEE